MLTSPSLSESHVVCSATIYICHSFFCAGSCSLIRIGHSSFHDSHNILCDGVRIKHKISPECETIGGEFLPDWPSTNYGLTFKSNTHFSPLICIVKVLPGRCICLLGTGTVIDVRAVCWAERLPHQSVEHRSHTEPQVCRSFSPH